MTRSPKPRLPLIIDKSTSSTLTLTFKALEPADSMPALTALSANNPIATTPTISKTKITTKTPSTDFASLLMVLSFQKFR